MNKELEALITWKANSIHDIECKLQADLISLKIFNEQAVLVEKQYDLIKQSLTPPTADEVCKALSEYYDKNTVVIYNVLKNKFEFLDNKNDAVYYLFDIFHYANIPPYLITMIGRFYENKENEK